MSAQEFLVNALTAKLEHHEWWSSFDFAFLQFLVWSSILASAAAAFLAATSSPMKWLTAALALVPALASTAESNISFSGRYKWHDEYAAELESMKRRVIVEGAEPKAVSAELTILEKEMNARFPTATVINSKDTSKAAPRTSPAPSAPGK